MRRRATIGRILIRVHRPLRGSAKTGTMSRQADGCYACIACAEVPIEPLPRSATKTGIDGGLKVVLITAAGEPVEHPRHDRRAEQQLATAQRRVRRP